jgi:cyclohexanecarboxyl-CoA dehydrogenase
MMVDFRFSPEQEQFRETIRRFAQSELAPLYRDGDITKAFPRRQMEAMARLGLTGLRIPEAFGGSLHPCVVSGIAAELIGRADFNSGYFVEQIAIHGEFHSSFTSPILQQRYLPGMADGS